MQLPGRNQSQMVASMSMDNSRRVVVGGFSVSESLRAIVGWFMGV